MDEQQQQGVAKNAWGERSRVLHRSEMAARQNANGSVSTGFAEGAVSTGERVRVHQTTQPAGTAPPPLHPIAHTEIICVREGVIGFVHDGREETARAGDVVYIVKGTVHQVRNAGDGPASYFVVAIGGDV